LYYPDCFLRHIAEGRRKFGNGFCNGCNGCNGCQQEGRRKFGNGLCNGCNGCQEEGRKPFDEAERVTRRKKEEGRRKKEESPSTKLSG
jgi:hypothetical protein